MIYMIKGFTARRKSLYSPNQWTVSVCRVRAKECSAISGRVIASSFALACFAAACLFGIAAGNELSTIITRATLAMMICYIIGRVVGAIAQQTIDAHVAAYKNRFPIPSDTLATDPPASGDAGDQPGVDGVNTA